MPLTIAITVKPPELLAQIREKLEHRTPFNARLATRLKQMLQDNFAVREGEPNKNNWKKTGYFERLRNHTTIGAVDDNRAEVLIADPDRSLARKLNPSAGPITPKEAKYLAIPARSEAYGKTPRSFGDLKFVQFGRTGVAALVQIDYSKIAVKARTGKYEGQFRTKRGDTLGGLVFYWLVKSANPPPDPRAVPPIEEITKGVGEEAKFYLEELKSP